MKNIETDFDTIDKYILNQPEETRKILNQIRSAIKETIPEATEKISYQMPTFYFKGNLLHSAAFKNHIGIYPSSSGIEAFKNDLAGYETSKGTIRFPIGKPVPLELI